MLAVLVGIVGALVYGSADFIGGLAAKRISALRVTALGGFSGLVLLLILLPFIGGTWSWSAVLLGGLSGISGALAVSLLYACLAIGPMSVLSPITALVSAVVPVLAGVIRGERLSSLGYIAILVALVAVVLVGFVPEKGSIRPSPQALAMAFGAGTLIGVFLILIDLTPSDSRLVPLILNRTVNTIVMFSAIAVLWLVSRRSTTRRNARGVDVAGAPNSGAQPTRTSVAAGGTWRPGLVLALVGGVTDALANAVLLLGLRIGELTIQSVLTALYPAGTIILAAFVLKERIAKVQIVGMVLALVAAAMLAATMWR